MFVLVGLCVYQDDKVVRVVSIRLGVKSREYYLDGRSPNQWDPWDVLGGCHTYDGAERQRWDPPVPVETTIKDILIG